LTKKFRAAFKKEVKTPQSGWDSGPNKAEKKTVDPGGAQKKGGDGIK
jgi:hypothetical protein